MIAFGPIKNSLHVVIDIQRLFAESTPWQVMDMPSIVPCCTQLIRHNPARTVFARFITPTVPEAAVGRWQDYYLHWRDVALDRMCPDLLDVLPQLTQLAPTAPVLDKTGYSVFSNTEFDLMLEKQGIESLLLSGVETDVCVLSTALAAVDRGLRVIIVNDAVTSGSPEGHSAALEIIRLRFDQQIETASTAEVLAAWTN